MMKELIKDDIESRCGEKFSHWVIWAWGGGAPAIHFTWDVYKNLKIKNYNFYMTSFLFQYDLFFWSDALGMAKEEGM